VNQQPLSVLGTMIATEKESADTDWSAVTQGDLL